MKTKPWNEKQAEGARRLNENFEYYALAAAQGSGKTWMWLNDIEYQYEKGRIDSVVIVAPKGVHINWIVKEAKQHLSVDWVGDYWSASVGKKRAAEYEKKIQTLDKLLLFTFNTDALNTKKGYELITHIMRSRRATMMIMDESQRIKNPKAKCTEKAISLRKLAVSARIGSGTMMPLGPPDLFSQYEFLKPYGKLLGTTSYRSFVAEFADVLPPDHKIVIAAMERARTRFVPQIYRRDEKGRPMWKNLEKLRKMLRPITYRIRKEDLGLPPQVYENVHFELSASERREYNQILETLRFEHPDGELELLNSLTAQLKLMQASSGFIMRDGQVTTEFDGQSRFSTFKDLYKSLDGQVIVFAVFTEEINRLCEYFEKEGIPAVRYDGAVRDDDRTEAIRAFQAGEAKVFIGQPQAAGLGITLTKGDHVVYYTCNHRAEDRMQSEDRSHRIGREGTVYYWNLIGLGTLDGKIAASNGRKETTMFEILDELNEGGEDD